MMRLEDLLELGLGFVRASSPEPIDRDTLIDDVDETLEELAQVKLKLQAAEAERDAVRAKLNAAYEQLRVADKAFQNLYHVLRPNG